MSRECSLLRSRDRKKEKKGNTSKTPTHNAARIATMTTPTDLPPRVHGGGSMHAAAAAAALAAAPLPTLASLPQDHVAQLGQSPAVFKPPSPARYQLCTGSDGVAALTM